jgi:EmrB/QacA subfamily drug resistance transporter
MTVTVDTGPREPGSAHLEGLHRPRRARWLVEPRRPPSIRERPNAWWLAVAAVCIGAFMGQLDASIVTLALPALQAHFRTSLGAVTWVGLSYLIVLVATVTAVGRFADMAGRKLLYMYGFVVFIVGSALCGAAPTLGALFGFRALQAVGAAMLQANSVAIVALVAPSRRLGRALGVQGAAQALGLALGPTAGGLLLAAGGWRLVFLVNVPIGLIGAAAGWAFIPRSRDLQSRTPFDWAGLALFFPAVVALLAAVSFGNAAGWRSPLILGMAGASVAGALAFVWRERRARAPMLDLKLFARARFSAGVTSGLLSYLVLFGVLFTVPFFLERSLGWGAGRAGIELMAMPLALGMVAPFAGRLADRVGPRSPTVGGMALVAMALVLLSSAHGATGPLLAGLAGAGAGLGLFISPNNSAIMDAVPRAQAGLASGVLNMTRGMGTAMGLAFAGLVFELAGGDSSVPGTVGHAFSVTMLFLAAVAVAAGVLSALRGGTMATARPPMAALAEGRD